MVVCFGGEGVGTLKTSNVKRSFYRTGNSRLTPRATSPLSTKFKNETRQLVSNNYVCENY